MIAFCLLLLFSFAEYFQPSKPISIQPFPSPSVSLIAGMNSVFQCNGTVAGNNTQVTLQWAIPISQGSDYSILPPATLSITNLTQEMVDTYCQGRSGAFNLPPQSFLGPIDNISLAPEHEGAVVLLLKAGLLICGANPSLSNAYTCLATNVNQELSSRPVLYISVPSNVLPSAIIAVIVIVLVTIFFLAVIGWCCFLRYRSKLKKYDFVPMTRRSHIPSSSQRSRHSFTNLTFDQYPNDSPSDTEGSSLEFSRDKLHFLSVLGRFLTAGGKCDGASCYHR